MRPLMCERQPPIEAAGLCLIARFYGAPDAWCAATGDGLSSPICCHGSSEFGESDLRGHWKARRQRRSTVGPME